MAKLSLKYADLQRLIGAYAVSQRTESRQFLAWFLHHYYRLEETTVDDSICDGPDDKTIDGIWTNEQSGEIHVFQAKIVKGDKSLGDVSLKEFYGSLSQFTNRQCVEHIAATTKNKELAELLRDLDIAGKIEKGYRVIGVFVTNAARDHNAKAYLRTVQKLQVFDEMELQQSFVPSGKSDPIASAISFDVSDVPVFDYPIDTLSMAIAPIAASDLLKMQGIKNGELFNYNVRQLLVRSKVNEDIATSIKNQDEHKYFPAFHNGITVLCTSLKVGKEKITIAGYAVVNGCQSLSQLYQNQTKVSPDLRILTKFIQTPPEGKLAAKITDHTNNQNGTTARDLQSNNLIQTRLQTEISAKGEFYYRIKRGEHPDWDQHKVIENDVAARVLLAFDVREPWSCHQTYKLFDELHARIFGRVEVTGERITTLYKMYQIIRSKLNLIENQLFANYSITQYFLVYLLRKILETDSLGKEFCADTAKFTATKKDQQALYSILDKMAQAMVRMVNREAKRRDADPTNIFDFKRELKSPNAVRAFESTVLVMYQILSDDNEDLTFASRWKEAKKK